MKKTEKKIRKQKRITVRLIRGIALILLFTAVVPLVAYNNLPDWVYYITSATKLWIAVDELNSDYQSENFLSALRNLERNTDSNVEIYNADGELIYSTRQVDPSLPVILNTAKPISPNYKLDYVITEGSVESKGKGFLLKAYDEENIRVDFLVCYNYFPNGERIEVCMQVSQITQTAKLDFVLSFVTIMLMLALALGVVAIFISRFSRPIKNMCEITDNMSKLDFSKKCPETKIVEFTQLSESINRMSDALDSALGELKTKNDKLLEDIENEKTIDNLRQTFISGISHELKTPIAIIQGYAEGAKMFYASGNAEAADQYCSVIMEEATRMNNMIMKLLEITKYDSGAYAPQNDKFSVYELVQDWFERNEALLAEKEITAENTVDKSFIGDGDSFILGSVVNNYLSNAVSHISGKRLISTYAVDTGEAYRVYVFNTGEPIANKDIDKIWTSFYRADKSLSRSQGRFGLGLAIVASIQKIHGQKYGVENCEYGVRFWFDIKKSKDENTDIK